MDQKISDNIRIQAAMRDMLAKYEWDYFVTANLNGATNWLGAKRLLKNWHARLDRNLLGPKWQKQKSDRTFFVACCEGAETNLHWHLLVRLGSIDKALFEKYAEPIWGELIPSGSLHLQSIESKADSERAAGYATKGFWRNAEIEQFVLSTEF